MLEVAPALRVHQRRPARGQASAAATAGAATRFRARLGQRASTPVYPFAAPAGSTACCSSSPAGTLNRIPVSRACRSSGERALAAFLLVAERGPVAVLLQEPSSAGASSGCRRTRPPEVGGAAPVGSGRHPARRRGRRRGRARRLRGAVRDPARAIWPNCAVRTDSGSGPAHEFRRAAPATKQTRRQSHLVAHLEEQRALPAATVLHSVIVADERLQRRRAPSGSPRVQLPSRTGPRTAASPARLTAPGPATRRRRRSGESRSIASPVRTATTA